MATAPAPRKTWPDRFLSAIERIGNALPHPATLFAIFALSIVILSWLLSRVGLSAVNPRDGSLVEPINLISTGGLHWILEHTIENYTGFAPLGTVLVALLGIGVAEKSGLIGTALRLLVHAAPRHMLTFVMTLAAGPQTPRRYGPMTSTRTSSKCVRSCERKVTAVNWIVC